MARRSRRLAAVLATLLAACGGAGAETSDGPSIVTLTAAPVPVPAPSPSPLPSQGPAAASGESDVAQPTTPERTGPSSADRARFVASYRPEGATDLDHVAIDLDDDDTDEIVFSYVVDTRSRVDVAWWGGEGYAIGSRGEGGSATLIDSLRIADVNEDDVVEIVVLQRDDVGSSLSLWGVTPGRDLVGLRAEGGCHDGSYTYGVVGADLTDTDGDGVAEIVATCDDSPLPVRAWSEDTYRWSGEAYVAEPRLAPSPSPAPSPDGDEDDEDDEGGDDGDDG